MKKIAVVILNWNGVKLLEQFLPSVMSYSPEATIYLADNASTDSSIEFVKTNYPDIDNLDKDIPKWQKQLLDKRLETIAKNPASIKSIDELFNELDSDI